MVLKVPFGTEGNVGDEVNFYDENNDLAFAGYIETKDTTGQITLDCEDYGSILKRSITNEIFIDKLAEEIIESVVTAAGLTYVSTITSTEIIPTYSANKKNSQEIVEELADKLLANYATDVLKNFNLEIEGGTTSTKTISNVNATITENWEEDITELVNSVYVEGDSRSIFAKEESFSGDNSTTEFELVEIPIDIRVEHPVGTLLTGYVEGQSTGDYQIKREQKKIIFDTAPSSGSNNIFIAYTASIPVSVRRRNAASIALYQERNTVVRKNWIITRDDARSYANYMITNFSSPLVNSTWSLTSQTDINDWKDFEPNQLIFVNDDLRGFNDFYIIRKVERNYGGGGAACKITVGSRRRNLGLWDKQVADRIRQLEVRDENNTVLNEDEFVQENLTIQFDSDITQIQKRTFDSDTFYLEENSSGSRNQMLESGLGDIMRETGYTTTDIDGLNDNLVAQSGDNLVTQSGDNLIAQSTTDTNLDVGVITALYQTTSINDSVTELASNITHIAVGDDNTAPTTSDTALGNETYREALFDPITTTPVSVSATMFMDVTENNGNDIKETGTFNAGAGGTMYNRALTNVIAKDATNEVFIEINFLFSSVNIDLD